MSAKEPTVDGAAVPMTTTAKGPTALPRLPASLTAFAAASATAPTPLNIAHRGFKARWPENSLAAFRAALDPAQGAAQAIETDVHLTRDGVVVLSHDPTLRRCFGRTERICDCDWAMLAGLRTTATATGTTVAAGEGQPMARLADVLTLLAEPAHQAAWMLLDIKRDDPPAALLQRVADTIAAAPGDWTGRIVLGCWQAVAMRLCRELMPTLPVAYIGFSLACAEALLAEHGDVVQVFNLEQHVLVGRRGARFVQAAQQHATSPHYVLAWTVNAPEWMEWCVRRGLNGVIGDDPSAYAALRQARGQTAATEQTPLQGGTTRSLGPYPHPADISSWTGFFVRRWTRLYAVVGLVRGLAHVFNTVMWLRFGSWKVQLRAALG